MLHQQRHSQCLHRIPVIYCSGTYAAEQRLKLMLRSHVPSDGEDHDSFPREAAQIAAGAGATLPAFGLGDPVAGAVVPAPDKGGQAGARPSGWSSGPGLSAVGYQ